MDEAEAPQKWARFRLSLNRRSNGLKSLAPSVIGPQCSAAAEQTSTRFSLQAPVVLLPGEFDEGHEAAGDQGVAAQEHR